MSRFNLAFIGALAIALFLPSCEDGMTGAEVETITPAGTTAGEYKVVFSTGDPDTSAIALMNADGTGLWQITPSNGFRNIFPVISPDGKRVAFQSLRNRIYGIHIVNIDGTNAHLLTPDGATPEWSPDGTRLVYTSQESGNPDLWVINADGTGKRPLTTSLGRDFNPSWSPDGKSIAFISDREQPNQLRLYVMNADGSNQRRLTDDDYAGSAFHRPSPWSPDSRRIAYTAGTPGNPGGSAVFVVNVDGTAKRQLTDIPQEGTGNPCWSPDGKSIAFTSFQASDMGIFVMMADGTGRRRITLQGAPAADNAAWSPGGGHILFVRSGAVMMADADGTDVQRIPSDAARRDDYPRWSPVRIR